MLGPGSPSATRYCQSVNPDVWLFANLMRCHFYFFFSKLCYFFHSAFWFLNIVRAFHRCFLTFPVTTRVQIMLFLVIVVVKWKLGFLHSCPVSKAGAFRKKTINATKLVMRSWQLTIQGVIAVKKESYSLSHCYEIKSQKFIRDYIFSCSIFLMQLPQNSPLAVVGCFWSFGQPYFLIYFSLPLLPAPT